jgi:membrane protein
MSLSTLWTLLKRTVSEWSDDQVSRLSASLAFYAVFSVAPLLVIVVVIGGAFFGKKATSRQVHDELRQQVGATAADGIEHLMQNAYGRPSSTGVAAVLGVVVLLYAATNTFTELQSAMNQIWDVEPRPGRFWWDLIKTRLLSFAMVLIVGLLLLLSVLLSTAMAAVTHYLHIPAGWRVAGAAVSFILSGLLFATIYKVLPDVKLDWGDVWTGAAITAVLFTVGKFLISLYLTRSSTSSLYGAAGSLAVLLLWVYYSAQVFFIGAEITQILAHRYGMRIEPTENAVRTEEAQPKARAAKPDGQLMLEWNGSKGSSARPARDYVRRHRTALAAGVGFLAGLLVRGQMGESRTPPRGKP